MPTVASSPGSRAWFEAYLNAFNRSDFAALADYYADDVVFAGQAASLSGGAAIISFYREVKARLDETIRLLTFVGDAGGCAAEIHTVLIAREDWPDFPTGAMRAGERRESVNFALYEVAGGRFTRIRSANFRRGAPV